jgi:hypothetical protein
MQRYAFSLILALGLATTLYSAPSKVRSKVSEITVSPKQDLARIVSAAKPGATILLKDGTYKLGRPLVFHTPNVHMRSASGNRDKVILDGKKGTGKLRRDNCINEIVAIRASNVRIADLSIRHARDHGIHVSPQKKSNIKNVVMHNVHVYDCGQQLIKVNSNGGKPLYWTDDCVLEDSLIEFTDTSIMHDMGKHFYTGGIDVHGGKGWLIRRNTFRNIQREGKLMEHAVHMWSKCRGTVVEGNRFIDCYRAVGFGMKTKASGLIRNYPDGKGNTPYFDHIEGVIRNNIVFNRKGIHLESGIELMNVIDVKVYHNTIVSHDKPFSSIEFRWPDTRVEIVNNIVSHTIKPRNGAKAVLKNNIENAPASLFIDYKKGDLHLSSRAAKAINKGMRLKDPATVLDIDGNKRDTRPDIGADEWQRK